MLYKEGTEVYLTDPGIFCTIIKEAGKYDTKCIVKDNETGISYNCIEEYLVPTNYNLIEKGNPGILTFTMAGRIPGKIFVDKKPKLIVAVGDNERNVAHFHVFRSDKDLRSWNNGSCIMFTENRYFDHGKRNKEILTRHELNALKMKLKSTYEEFNMTFWKWIIILWNNNNPNYSINTDLKMPEYDYDTIKNYKED